MKEEFGYNWERVIAVFVFGLPTIACVAWVASVYGHDIWIVGICALIWMLIKETFSLCQVRLSEGSTHFEFWFPYRKDIVIENHPDAANYHEIMEWTLLWFNVARGTGGIVNFKDGRLLFLWSKKIKNFAKLNQRLAERYPPPDKETQS